MFNPYTQEKAKNNFAKQKDKKKDLMQQFVSKTKQNEQSKRTQDSSSKTNETVDTLKEIRKAKKEIKKLKSHLANRDKENANLKLDIEVQKSKVSAQQQIQRELRETVTTLQTENQILQDTIQKHQSETVVYQKKYDTIIEKFKNSKTNKLKSKVASLQKVVDQQNNTIQNLRHKIMLEQTEPYEIKTLQTQLANLSRERNNLGEKLKQYRTERSEMSISTLITILEENLTEDNARETYDDGSSRLAKLAKEAHTFVVRHDRKLKYQNRLKINQPEQTRTEEIHYGYALFQDFNWYFVDSSDFYLYRIEEFEGKLLSEQPISVYIKDSKAYLKHRYLVPLNNDNVNTIYNQNKDSTELYEKSSEQEEPLPIVSQVVLLTFPPYRVLVIGSRFLTKYKNALQNLGLIVETHNPYEENDSRLYDKYRRAHIVLACKQHMSHDVYHVVDRTAEHVHILELDTIDRLVARVQFSSKTLPHLIHFEKNKDFIQEWEKG